MIDELFAEFIVNEKAGEHQERWVYRARNGKLGVHAKRSAMKAALYISLLKTARFGRLGCHCRLGTRWWCCRSSRIIVTLLPTCPRFSLMSEANPPSIMTPPRSTPSPTPQGPRSRRQAAAALFKAAKGTGCTAWNGCRCLGLGLGLGGCGGGGLGGLGRALGRWMTPQSTSTPVKR
jgi:hypothetical protein